MHFSNCTCSIKLVNIIVDRQPTGVPKIPTNVFGTLPRRDKERLDIHRPLQSKMSVSYPNLNELESNFGRKCGTLQRKDAIRKKQKPSWVHDQNFEYERVLQLPDPDVDHCSQNLPSGRTVNTGRRSEGTQDPCKVTRFFSKLFRRGNHSAEPDEIPSRFSPVLAVKQIASHGNRGTSSYEHLSPRHRSSTTAADDDYTKLFSPIKVVRNKVSPSDKTSKRHDILCTQQTTRYVKPVIQHPSGLNGNIAGFTLNPDRHSPRREIGIDEAIPASPNDICGAPSIPIRHKRTPSDEKGISRQNAFYNGHNAARTPHRTHVQPTLSSVIPPLASLTTESYTTLNARIPPPSTDPYITCLPHIEVVNNTPYMTMAAKNGLAGNNVSPSVATVQNDQYIHCPRKPERPVTLNLTHAHTPESSGVSTGGSSAFSNLSPTDAVPPTVHAPPPPRPPIVPPRDRTMEFIMFKLDCDYKEEHVDDMQLHQSLGL
ncbi:hypothetical protein DICVIV_06551 [Dictyocaulus viviparus]|uniref:Uncharacterized protein n=1 Tax=Dictyocaulus viviparus TaxID=29172 RepID=A0A0D8XYB5_DICVI|nr:hypothetical protein DICVIV_06551 [Dictyocaulus viviparus]